MKRMMLFVLLCSLYSLASSATNCPVAPEPKGGVEWILHVIEQNYGWREHTHRAHIALAVSGWEGDEIEMSKMELQLELEITRFLLRNDTASVHENDLALFIHALIATSKNPRNFHGIDLVADLLHRVNSATGQVNPFLILVLCNSGAVEIHHLVKIKELAAEHRGIEIETRQQIEMKALTLKALACAAINPKLDKFQNYISSAVKCLMSKQNTDDGSFGNAYTTALAVQALVACGTRDQWDQKQAFDYLAKESVVQVNMIKTYLIVMALNAKKVKFIKDLYKGPPLIPGLRPKISHFVQYSINPNHKLYYTITIEVPVEWNFFKIMEKCSQLSEKYNFTYYSDEENNPAIYSVSGIPNDAEENMFWTICVRSRSNSGQFQPRIHANSPVKLMPKSDDHITFFYGESRCGIKLPI